MRKIVATEKAPAAIGPYAQAYFIGNMVFTSGQLGMDPATGNFVEGGIKEQTEQALKNLKVILEEAGTGMENVIKTTCFLKNMDDFAAMNEVYASFFEGEYPSRSAVQVAKLPKDGMVEIEAIAYIK